MPQGIQVWDASGNLIVDTSTYVLKGVIDLGTVETPGSANIPEITETGAIPILSVAMDATAVPPAVSISGSTVSWDRVDERSFRAGLRVVLV